MALDFNAPMTYLATLLDGLPVIQAAGAGVPTVAPAKISASVSHGRLVVSDRNLSQLVAERSYYILFVARLDGGESAAEYALGEFMAQLVTAIFADRTLGGTANTVSLAPSLTSSPEYMPMLGQEVRQYRIEVVASQRQNY